MSFPIDPKTGGMIVPNQGPMTPNAGNAGMGNLTPPPAPPMLRPPQAPPFPGGVPNQSGLPPPAVANQYGQAPVNPFAPGGVAAPQFSSMGTPPGPPKMTVPGAVTQGQPQAMPAYAQPMRDPNLGMPGVNDPATSLKAATSPFPLAPATSNVAPALDPTASIATRPPQAPSTFLTPAQPDGYNLDPSHIPTPGPIQTAPDLVTKTPSGGATLGQPVSSDIRAKTAVTEFPTPPGRDTSALDAAYQRSADPSARFAPSSGWTPAADMRAAKLYAYDYKNPDAPGAAPGRHTGPMAHELSQTVAAPAVSKGPDGLDRVDSSRVAMVNASATGELQRQVGKQQAQIDTLHDYIKAHPTGPREAEVSQPPPEWSYKPSSEFVSSPVDAKENIVPMDTDRWVAEHPLTGAENPDWARGSAVNVPGQRDFEQNTSPNLWARQNAVNLPQTPYTPPPNTVEDTGTAVKRKEESKAYQVGQYLLNADKNVNFSAMSDIRAKKNVQPVDYSTASFPTPIMPAGERALAASGSGAVQGGATPAPVPYDSAHDRALAAGYAWLAAHGDEAALKHEAPAPQLPAQRQMEAAGAYAPKPYWEQKPEGMEAMQSSQYGLPTQQEADMAAIAEEVRRRREGK